MNIRTLLPQLIITVTLFASCAKDGDTGPSGSPGPAGPSLIGNLTGFVNLFDQYGAHVLVDQDSALVSLDGTSLSSLSDSTGKYLISALSTGVYNITCTKSGYGTYKVNSQQFTGGGDLLRDMRLAAIPSFSVDSISAVSGPGGVVVTGHLQTDIQPRTVMIFVGSTTATSADPLNYLGFYPRNVQANQGTFQITIPASDFYALSLTSGSTAYFAAYGATPNYNNTSSYEDLNTGRSVFTALSTTMSSGSILVP